MSDSQVTTLDDAPETTVETKAKTTKAAKADAAKVSAAAADAGITGSTKSITIFQGEGEAGRDDVFVSVNGYAFNIKRGKPVDVPVEVVHVLQNAVTTRYENGEAVDVPRFAFAIHN